MVLRSSRWDVDVGWNETTNLNRRFGGFIEDVELFDSAMFAVSQPEAVAMDAQQRVLLETTYETLKLSTPRDLAGNILEH
jgi:acyl transferase domain-containing protein